MQLIIEMEKHTSRANELAANCSLAAQEDVQVVCWNVHYGTV